MLKKVLKVSNGRLSITPKHVAACRCNAAVPVVQAAVIKDELAAQWACILCVELLKLDDAQNVY